MPSPDLVTVQSISHSFGVSEETIRWWVKRGWIAYTLVGNRKMVRRSEILKTMTPSATFDRFDEYQLSDDYMRRAVKAPVEGDNEQRRLGEKSVSGGKKARAR